MFAKNEGSSKIGNTASKQTLSPKPPCSSFNVVGAQKKHLIETGVLSTQKHMFILIDKKMITFSCSTFLLISTNSYHDFKLYLAVPLFGLRSKKICFFYQIRLNQNSLLSYRD